MGMGVKHYWFHGTRKEIEAMQAALPVRKTDRILTKRPIYDHMNKHLGLEIWELCLSKAEFTDKVMDALKEEASKHEKLLWQVTWKNGQTIDNGLERFINYNEQDPGFPGPFGALCKLYEKTYW